MQGTAVGHQSAFDVDLSKLATKYPALKDVVKELEQVLKLDSLPEIPVDSSTFPGVYAAKLDYPPMGASGRQKFLVTYHATQPTPSPIAPYRKITLLTITELRPGE